MVGGELTGTLAAVILCRMSDLAPELARLSPRQRLDLIDQGRQHNVSQDQLKAELRHRD